MVIGVGKKIQGEYILNINKEKTKIRSSVTFHLRHGSPFTEAATRGVL